MEKGELSNNSNRKLNTNPLARKKLFEEREYRCVGCGRTEGQMILHHVVPIVKGGLDDSRNIVLLCPECHDKVHDLSLDGLRKPFRNLGGRPRTCSAEDEEKYYWQYVRCEIGTKELKEKIHTKPSVAIRDRPGFKEFLAKHHIKEHKNSIDMRTARKQELVDGEWLGHIIFEDGTKQEFFYLEPKKPEKPAKVVLPEVKTESIQEPVVETAEKQESELVDSYFRNMDVVEFEKWMFTHPNARENLRSHGA